MRSCSHPYLLMIFDILVQVEFMSCHVNWSGAPKQFILDIQLIKSFSINSFACLHKTVGALARGGVQAAASGGFFSFVFLGG